MLIMPDILTMRLNFLIGKDMIKFYNQYQFKDWHSDYNKIFNNSFTSEQIKKIETWITSDIPLGNINIFNLDGYSVWSECYSLNNNHIIKTTQLKPAITLYEKLIRYPILLDYIIPTYIYHMPNQHSFISEHLKFIQEAGKKICHYSDCLVLQPKCDIIEADDYSKWFYQNQELIDLQKNYKIDLCMRNAGYLNGEIKFFDW